MTSLAADLDVERLLKLLSGVVSKIIYRPSTISTNDDAVAWKGSLEKAILFTCQRQTAGRGRRGRTWIHNESASLAFTLLLACTRKSIAGASLAAGIGIAQALEKAGASVGLKWPNDLLDSAGRKVGGILIEAPGDTARLAVGIGLNLNVSADMEAQLGANAVGGLGQQIAQGDRTDLFAGLVTSLLEAMQIFNEHGFESFAEQWERFTVHRKDQQITITESAGSKATVAYQGIDTDGALIYMRDDQMRRLHSGEIE